jgi:hypothetical protein
MYVLLCGYGLWVICVRHLVSIHFYLLESIGLFVMQIEGLVMDIAAAEEEINRWKLAAEQEAAASTGVEQQFVAGMESY